MSVSFIRYWSGSLLFFFLLNVNLYFTDKLHFGGILLAFRSFHLPVLLFNCYDCLKTVPHTHGIFCVLYDMIVSFFFLFFHFHFHFTYAYINYTFVPSFNNCIRKWANAGIVCKTCNWNTRRLGAVRIGTYHIWFQLLRQKEKNRSEKMKWNEQNLEKWMCHANANANTNVSNDLRRPIQLSEDFTIFFLLSVFLLANAILFFFLHEWMNYN